MKYGFFIFIIAALHVQSSANPQVTLHDGSPISGKLTKSAQNKPVTEFLGIPFAEPPVRKLRFKKPVEKKPWRDTLFATERPKSCVQSLDFYFGNFYGATMWNSNVPMSEDCLYLNIYVPGELKPIISEDGSPKFPVMIWIYGGGFWSGCSTLDVYDGKIFSSEEEVIIVTMNYRVSVFGFLYVSEESAPGNMGLWDQLLAFKWVRKNIDVFGGDPDAITIFGESAGAASVGLHLLSRQSQPYFTRAAVQSGGPTSPWAIEKKQVAQTRAVILYNALCGNETGRRLKENSADWEQKKDIIYKCVMEANATSLREHEWSPVNEFADFPWVPIVDGDFLSELPLTSLKTGNFKTTQLLAGSNHDEAIYFIIYHLQETFPVSSFFNRSDFIQTYEHYRHNARNLIPRAIEGNPLLFNAVLHEYEPEALNPTPREWLNALDKMLGDLHFTCSVNALALAHSHFGGDTYYYYFTHRASQQTWPEWMGVVHGYEINFIFGEPLNEQFGYTYEEQSLSFRMMRYWANFARSGDPTKNKDGTQFMNSWPKYDEETMQYMNLTIDKDYDNGAKELGIGPRRKQCDFWNNLMPALRSALENMDAHVLRWKQAVDVWQNEYMVDWQLHFEQYKRYQSYRYADFNTGYC